LATPCHGTHGKTKKKKQTVPPGLRIILHDVPDMLEYVSRCLLSKLSNNKFQICIPDLDRETKNMEVPTRQAAKSMINIETPNITPYPKGMRLGAFNYSFWWAANRTRNCHSVCA
jgi:hypothetical protein